MRVRIKRCLLYVLVVSLVLMLGCTKEPPAPDFSGVANVCELATLKCYYHNVAKMETEANGALRWLGTGYKKIWIEYSGIVELGIDINQVSISQPDANGVVRVTIPDAEILNIDLDETSMGEPLTTSGFLTSITKEEETEALAQAQTSMEETARQDTALLAQAKERAKNLIENYIIGVGEMLGQVYTVEWVEL